MAYNLDETVAPGDSGHQTHHADIAEAVNDIDDRIAAVEAIAGVIHVDDIEDVNPGDYPVDTVIIQRAP